MEGYIHGFTSEEHRRLTRMQSIINEAEIDVLRVDGALRILDVGAGLGQMTRALARAAGPGARVLGIERDPRQIAEAERQAAAEGEAGRVELRPGSAEALPLEEDEWSSFDLAHARFLLEHVPDPQAVVRQMMAAVRPGGRIALVDDDHELLRLWPPVPSFERVWEVYWRSYTRIGCDPLVGRRLAALLSEAGAALVRVTTIFWGACPPMELFDPIVDNLREVVRSARDGLDEAGLLPRLEMDSGLEALARWRKGPTACLWYSLPFAEGRRPA